MGNNKPKNPKPQKEVAITEESEDEQSGQESEVTPKSLYSEVVTGSTLISGTTSTTTLPDSTLSGKRSSEEDIPVETKKQRRIRLANLSLQDVIHASADTERAASVEEMAELRRLVAKLATDNANFREEITSIKNQHSSAKSDTTTYGSFDLIFC